MKERFETVTYTHEDLLDIIKENLETLSPTQLEDFVKSFFGGALIARFDETSNTYRVDHYCDSPSDD